MCPLSSVHSLYKKCRMIKSLGKLKNIKPSKLLLYSLQASSKHRLVTLINRTNLYSYHVYCILYGTGLPKKDETSETTVLNLFYLYFKFIIPCNCKLVSFLPNHFKQAMEILYFRQRGGVILNLDSSYFKSFRSSLQSHLLWITPVSYTWYCMLLGYP